MKKLTKQSIENVLALTPMQEGMLFHYLQDPGSDYYFEQLSLEVSGEINREIFEKAWNFVIESNEMLRTTFRWEGVDRPLQIVLKEYKLKPIYYDFSIQETKKNQQKGPRENLRAKDRATKFDLREVPFRVTLGKLAASKYEILISNHHILYDGWSTGLLLQEFFRAYDNLAKGNKLLKTGKTKFSEFVKSIGDRDTKLRAKFWPEYLAGIDTPTKLSIKQIGQGTEISRTARYRIRLEEDLRNKIENFIKKYKITLASFLYSAWGLLLQRYNNCDDVVFGTTVSGRSVTAKIPGIEAMVGLFINTIPLRVQTHSGEKTGDFLERMNRSLQKREAYEAVSLVEIKEYSQLAHTEELFDSLVVLENYPLDEQLMSGDRSICVDSYDTVESTHYDLTLYIVTGAELAVNFVYKEEFFSGDTISRLADHFSGIMERILENPGAAAVDLEIISAAEKHKILSTFNRTGLDYPQDKTIGQLCREQAAKTPDHTAVVDSGCGFGSMGTAPGKRYLTYGALDKRADRWAGVLRTNGVKANCIVGLKPDRCAEMIIGLLSILKAGGAYLPLGPEHPQERLDYILAECKVDILLTTGPREAAPASYKTIDLQDLAELNKNPSSLIPPQHPNDNKPIAQRAIKSFDQTFSKVWPPAGSLAYVIYTSGSTGTPKGVMIENRSLVNFVKGITAIIPFTEGDGVLALTTLSFDIFWLEAILPLTQGAKVVVGGRAEQFNAGALASALEKEKITLLQVTPSRLQLITAEREPAEKLKLLKYLLVGGEAFPGVLLEKTRALTGGKVKIFNLYGPTETTIWSTIKEVSGSKPLNIGKPLANTRVYILSKHGLLQPLGVPGELTISGAGVARGYFKNDLLTQTRFVEDPFFPGQRMYKTGDLAKWLPGGDIEFLGRSDDQFKIRGFRIELAEIEKRLQSHPAIKDAVLAVKETGEDKYLCAYYTVNNELAEPDARLRAYLGQTLPEYMIPSYFRQIETIPLTPNGKINRKALPDPGIKSGTTYQPPGNESEKKLVEIWSEILGIDKQQIGIDDHFFHLGGHSLKAIRLINKIQKIFQAEISLPELFTIPTVRKMARRLQESKRPAFPEQGAVPAEEKEYYLLSSSQKRLFVLQQLVLRQASLDDCLRRLSEGQGEAPPGPPIKKNRQLRFDRAPEQEDNTAYNMHEIFLLRGKADKQRLEDLFAALIRRHESFRTSFALINGEIVQRVHREVRFAVESWAPGPGPSVDEIAREFIRPFDLARAPLLRAGLLELEEAMYLVMVDMHHIIADGISVELMMKEFKALYEGKILPVPLLQYKDYAGHQGKEKNRERLKPQETFWLRQFEGETPVLNLPTDFSRPSPQSFAGADITFEIDPKEIPRLKQCALAEETTEFVVMLAVYKIFLSKICSQEDIVVGVPTAGRRQADLEDIIGIFVNTLPLRSSPQGAKTFRQFLAEVKETALAAFANQDYQYEDLVEHAVVNRDLGRNPLFDTCFLLQKPETPEFQLPGLNLMPYPYERWTAKFDLTLEGKDTGESLWFRLEYGSKLFKRETITRWITYFKTLTTEVLRNRTGKLAELEWIPAEEKKQLLLDWNDTKADYPREKTLPRWFAEQVEKRPGQIALTGQRLNAPGPVHLSYRELNDNSAGLAEVLRERGVQADTIVAVMMERSLEMIIGIFAILKAGGAYLPIDPDYPAERVKYLLEDAKVDLVFDNQKAFNNQKFWEVSEGAGSPNLLEFSHYGMFDHIPPAPATCTCHHVYKRVLTNCRSRWPASSLAYVIYTSGSTGKPKGVMIEHRSVVNRLHWMQKAYPLGEHDAILQKTTYTFDVSVWELFWWSFCGARLCLLGPGQEKSPGAISESVAHHRITTIHFVPSMLNAFLDHLDSDLAVSKLKSLKQVFSSGEALEAHQVKRFNRLCGTGTRLVNLYGPTEATVDVSFFNCDLEEDQVPERIPIGKPIANIRLCIVNRYLKLQPRGIAGELCIAGDGVSRGYLNNPELTCERFINYKLQNTNYKQIPNYKIQITKKTASCGQSLNDCSEKIRTRITTANTKNARRAPSLTLNTNTNTFYKTGDLARCQPDGNIEFLGRMDHQVKIRGFRIELGEIETQLRQLPPVKDAAAAVTEGVGANKRLAAYVVPDQQYAFTVARFVQLKAQNPGTPRLHDELPNGMPVFYLNRGETDFMFKEIFTERSYLKHGITLNDGACIFDIGANIGLFSIFAYHECQNARIYSFEPVPPLYELLKLNTSMYGIDIDVSPYGISAVAEEAVFTYYPKAAILSGRFANGVEEKETLKAFIKQELQESGEARPTESQIDELLEDRLTASQFRCTLKPLSRVLREKELQRIDLLKIDVEKAEWEVLQGIDEEDWPKIRQLAVEVHDHDGKLDKIRGLLQKRGYNVTVDQDPSLRSTHLYNLYARFPGPEHPQEREPGQTGPKPVNTRCSPTGLIAELKESLKNKLPGYMIPSYVVLVDKIPLTASGKVDRAALPDPGPGAAVPEANYTAPASEAERIAAAIYMEVLNLDRVGIHDDIFALGGNSLDLIKINQKLRNALGKDIPVTAMFECKTLHSLLDYIAARETGERVSRGKSEQEALNRSQASITETLPLFDAINEVSHEREN